MKLGLLVLESSLFFITHLALSHGSIRQNLVDKLGEWGFRGVYSLMSLITLGPAIAMMAVSTDLEKGPVFWESSWPLYPVAGLLVLLGMLLVALATANPSPTGMMPAAMVPRGVLKITRHPMNMGIAIFALAHLIANGNLGDLFFFGSLFLTGFVGAYHQDRRKARQLGDEFKTFQDQTSILPFAALIRGKTKFEKNEFSWPVLIITVIAFVALIFLHGRFFGARLVPWF